MRESPSKSDVLELASFLSENFWNLMVSSNVMIKMGSVSSHFTYEMIKNYPIRLIFWENGGEGFSEKNA